MVKESLQSVSRNCIFRETFTPESIAKNGGVITGGVTLNDGVATFNGTTGYITYANGCINQGKSFTIRARIKNAQVLGRSTLLGTNYFDLEFNITPTKLNMFYGVSIDVKWREMNISHNITDWAISHEIIFSVTSFMVSMYIDGLLIGSWAPDGNIIRYAIGYPPIKIGIRDGVSQFFKGDMELVEIYDKALSAEEVSLLSSNNLYTGYVKDGLVLDCDYTQGTVINKIYPELAVTATDVSLAHGVGAVFNGTTSLINYGTPNIFDFGTGGFSVEWVDTYPMIQSINGFSGILSKGQTSSAPAKAWGLLTNGATVNGIIYYESNNAGGSYDTNTLVFTGIPDGKHHYVLVRDVINHTLTSYMDGILKYSGSYTLNQDVTNAFVFTCKQAGARFTSGILSTVRAYKGKALTANEVMLNYTYAKSRGWVQ